MSERDSGGLPPWARAVAMVGVPALIAFFLLGMIPGLPSPIYTITQKLDASANAMQDHERTAREQLRVSRHICRALWKGDPIGQAGCSGRNGTAALEP